MSDVVHQPPAPDAPAPPDQPDHRDQAGHFRMTLRLPPDAAEALSKLAPPGERCDLIAYLLRCELRRQGIESRAA